MPRESKAKRKARTARIAAILHKVYPDAKCELDHRNPLELLVATILSAQCTDVRVNIVTKDLFARYKTAADYADAAPKTLEDEIRSTGFFRNKTKSLRGMGRALVETFAGQVPRTMDELLTLPGVARKTANVVLSTAFGVNAGVVVDTHVTRLSGRLRLSNQTDPKKIERDLMGLLPQNDWGDFAHLLVFHGRRCCVARKPHCADCAVSELCPSAFTFGPNAKPATRTAARR